MKTIALITGATAGIGEATAFRMAAAGFNLIITGRRKDRLEALAADIKQKHNVEVLPLAFDVSNCAEVEAAIASLPEEFSKIDVLVNNAGLGLGYARFEQCSTADWDTMIDTNVKGVLYMSRIVAQKMAPSGEGLIINVGSIAGTQTSPNGVVYAATKAALHSMTLGMRVDLLPLGIRVSEVRPGVTRTEFVDVRAHGDLTFKDKVYGGLEPLEAKDLAEAIGWIATQPTNVNISELEITPQRQASVNHLLRK